MNNIEKEIVDVLKCLKNDYGVFEIKAEFEAEGSRMEEMMRLKDITSQVGLPIILKIGGVEAVTDVYNALALGVKGCIAPMAETKYSLSKFTDLIDNFVAPDNAADIEFGANIETLTACNNFDDMLTIPNISNLSGITIGRVDLVGSMGLSRDAINTSEEVKSLCKKVFLLAKEYGFKTAMGGGISLEAFPVIKEMNSDGLIDKYETRKVVFPSESVSYGESSVLKAVEFELLWLKSKERYYSRIKLEDKSRIEMLEKRLT
jgi:4-hydroxy-2-oxoheptanedioate aldolase